MSMPNLPPPPAGLNPSAISGGLGKLGPFRQTLQRIGHWMWVPGWSLPAQAAFLTTAVLLVCVVAVWLIFDRDPTSVPWRFGMTPRYLGILISLILIIPAFVYLGLRVLVESDRALFPDLDYAWTAGLEALRSSGLPIETTPIYLVLGSAGDDEEIDLFRSSGKGFRVRGIPEGPAALHWYAHADAIYLCCTETSVLSQLAQLAQKNARDKLTGRGPAGEPSSTADGPTIVERALNLLSLQQISFQSARLRTLCRLLRIARDPAIPVNGILTLLPYQMAHLTPREIQQLAEAVEADVRTIQETLQVRCPVTAVVTGLDQHPGFRELMRRVGVERTTTMKFGQAFDLRGDATTDALQRFSNAACSAFDEWAEVVFHEPDVLSRPGNLPLFSLLCEVRSQLKVPLGQVLSRGFGYTPGPETSLRRLVFSGCYFAACSRSPDRQAFVQGVFNQLENQQDAVEWLPTALRRDQRIRAGVALGYVTIALLLTLISVQILATRLP